MEKLISYLFHSQTQVHIFHLQTTSEVLGELLIREK
jgi:hypothetical protein